MEQSRLAYKTTPLDLIPAQRYLEGALPRQKWLQLNNCHKKDPANATKCMMVYYFGDKAVLDMQEPHMTSRPHTAKIKGGRGGGVGPTHKTSGAHTLNIRGFGNFAIINPVNM